MALPRALKGPAVFILIASLYVVAGKLGLAMSHLNPSVSAVWPPAGIALAALLLVGYRIWPAILLGAFLVNLTTAGSAVTCLGIAAGNTLEGLAGAWLATRFAHGRRAFDRAQDVLRLALLAGHVSTAISATVGVTCLSLAGLAPWARYGSIWLTWWLGDAMGVLMIAPVALLWSRHRPVRWERGKTIEGGTLLLCLVVLGWTIFGGLSPLGAKAYPLAFLCLPPILWIALRFGQREAATATLVLSVIALIGTLRGFGPFAWADPNESLLLLQCFMGVVAVTVTAVAAVVAERELAEASLRTIQAELEARVRRRTAELTSVVETLQEEIGERRRAAEALSASEERFRSVAQIANEAIILSDGNGRIIAWYGSAQATFGYPEEDVLGEPLSILMPERFRDAHHAGMKRLRETRVSHLIGKTVELSGLRSNGEEFPMELSLTSWSAHDETFYTGIIRDITERRNRERERRELYEEMERRVEERTAELHRSNDELQQFAYVASHDLQEPLRMVASFTELLSRRYHGKLDADANEFIGYIVGGASRMHQLINDLLTYSRLGTHGTSPVSTNLEEVLAQVLDNLQITIKESDAVVTHSRLPVLMADSAQMVQLLQNLVSNAIRFRHKDRRPQVRIELEPRDGEWLFAVRDNGIGIDPKFWGRIFVIFQRLHPGGKCPGTGIGLAICKKIVERHGGRIWLESEPGTGSSFYFTLPRQREADV